MRRLNKTLAGLMAAVMVLLGVSVTPVEAADAAAPTEVDYVTEFAIANYWNATNPVAPVKDGYVFGGWYTANTDGTYTPIKETELKADLAEEDGKISTYADAVAKFVPSYVLSVKIQINTKTEATPAEGASRELPFKETTSDGVTYDYTNMRLLSAVDSVKYQNVGFDIVLNKTVVPMNLEYEKVYQNLGADTDSGKTTLVASELFGSPATHFIAAELSNIVADNLDKIIYVTPYWTTIDGTKVEGASKYVRVMDGYAENKYISIPVNILTNVNAAAGMVQMTYPTSLKYVEWEEGVLYTEMAANTATAGTIKFVGNGDKVDATYMTGEEIYANVWFQYTGDLKTLTRNSLAFTMDTESFCSWDEELLSTVKAWDVLY